MPPVPVPIALGLLVPGAPLVQDSSHVPITIVLGLIAPLLSNAPLMPDLPPVPIACAGSAARAATIVLDAGRTAWSAAVAGGCYGLRNSHLVGNIVDDRRQQCCLQIGQID